MKTLKYNILFTALLAVLITGCESLDVKNENDPDFLTAFSSSGDIKGVAGGLINTWFITVTNYDGLYMPLAVGADASTCSHGNAAMRDFSYEPRIAWDNSPSYSNALCTEQFYKDMYSLLSSSNDILAKVVTGGMIIEGEGETDDTPLVMTMAYLCQGMAFGYVGLFFDKAFVVTETTDLSGAFPTSTYQEVITEAVNSLDKCIAVCESSTFTVPASWIPGMTYTQKEIGELANSMAASFLSYSPRNKTENDGVDWSRVLAYANKGLTYDFSPESDFYNWGGYIGPYYLNAAGWGQVDMRLINLMHPAMPSRWVGADQWDFLPTPVTAHTEGVDDRIFTDYQALTTCGFRVERGYYHFSNYRFSRMDNFIATKIGPVTLFRKAENDLLKAEALLQTGDLNGAADIINTGTRVTRGKLTPIGVTAAAIEGAIWHERFIELFCTNCGNAFCFMRKADKLQPGTPLHFPIPGQQLEVNLMETYSFGPDKGVAGQDYSNGGWF